MKNKFAIALTLSLAFHVGNGLCQQNNDLQKMLSSLPQNWVLQEKKPVTYKVTTTHNDYHLMGDFISKTRITALYTRGLAGSKVRWNDVRIAHATAQDQSFPAGEPQLFMEDFTYSSGDNVLSPAHFSGFPPGSHMQKNLVWDMLAFESFAWNYSDSLALNRGYSPGDISMEMDLAGEGSFTNKEITLTWSGITLMDNELCAIITFSVMNNPLAIDTEAIRMKGRSHYWGDIYVSLVTKQIEYCVLFEDVISEIRLSTQADIMKLNTVRTVVVEKMQ